MAWTVPATVIRLLTPTTFEATLDLGWHVYAVRIVRVAFVTPPLPGTDQYERALSFAHHHIGPGTQIEVTSYFEADVAGCSVAQVRIIDRQDYAALLFSAGLAMDYEGVAA